MLVTLTTDFGPDSGYPGQVKGVLYSRAPGVQVVDLSHAIPSFDITSAALLLEECWQAFPRGTVHLAVVDPGVGGPRRALACELHGHRFVGPDNGIFEFLLARAQVHAIERSELFRQPVSSTFHARDVFAPVAAYLASGGLLTSLGPLIGDPVRLEWEPIERVARGVRAQVLRSDSFGNLQTRLRREDLPLWGEVSTYLIRRGEPPISLGPIRRTYSDGSVGQLVPIWGSSGRLELAINLGSAARQVGFRADSELSIQVDWK